jgi:two-component system NtrC family response regulator
MNSKATILVVDDDTPFLMSLHIALSKDGYTVAGASDPRAAIDCITNGKHRFDVIVTDLHMPGINGVHFLRLVKQSFPDVPVILVTAFGELDSYAEALGHGAFAYLNKPFDKQGLVRLIEQALQPRSGQAAP